MLQKLRQESSELRCTRLDLDAVFRPGPARAREIVLHEVLLRQKLHLIVKVLGGYLCGLCVEGVQHDL